MKNIVIINQHTRNHGDEAACIALVRSLFKRGFKDITIIYNDYEDTPWNRSCEINYENIKHVAPVSMNRWMWRAIKLFFKLPANIGYYILLFSKDLRFQYKIIKSADFVISAPSGPNLGKYKDPLYLWRLLVALGKHKKYAIYSPSIGPFPNDDVMYLHNAIKVLSKVQFISLRDQQSYKYAEKLGVQFIKAIDTAYLEDHHAECLPFEVKSMLPDKYVVIVPHELYKWHPDFKNLDSTSFDKLYISIINKFLSSNLKVVLLPQTFESNLADEGYFLRLKSDNPNIIVIPTKYSSDVQQKIIESADFVVGARYHSIVFAINNLTPFYCLSYEYKMIDMLKIFNMSTKSIDIKIALDKQEEIASIIFNEYLDRNKSVDLLKDANELAKKMALNCFDKFVCVLYDGEDKIL